MKPQDLTYAITRCYISDSDANADLIKKIGGFHRSRNLSALASCTCHFDEAYHTVNDLRFLMQIEAFFKKNALFSNEEVCNAAASVSFKEAEDQCNKTNLRLDYFYLKRHLINADLKSKLSRMERYIRNVLGDFRTFLDELPHLVKVTSGATSTASRRHSIPQLKLKGTLHATSGASPYLSALYRFYGFERPKIIEVKTNRVEPVPKNFKTSRTIACEPEGNLPLQLAFDSYAKRRLRLFGIDLSNQFANQEAALAGSLGASYATIDFKGASETVSYNAVAWFFPYDWFTYLSRIRSRAYRSEFLGSGSYSKFSSMGNGATFCIETLLFAGMCYAVGSKDFLVYGDDVILEEKYLRDYRLLAQFLGFTINEDKSHSTGSFRESCGVNVFKGVDVTPFYIRNIDRRKAMMCHLINGLVSIALPGGRLEQLCLSLLKKHKLPLVPFSENTTSGVFITPEEASKLGIMSSKRKSPSKRRWPKETYIQRYKSYIPYSRKRSFRFYRGYYLWFLRKRHQVSFAVPWFLREAFSNFSPEPCTSSAPIFGHAFVRKWVFWQMPKGGIPVHLYWWTEQVRGA